MSIRSALISVILAVSLLSLGFLAGCPGPAETPPPGGPAVTSPPPGGRTITQAGSSTILPIAQKWQEAYNQAHPDVNINISGEGSGVGLKALIGKSCDIADASRKIKAEEIEQAQAAGVNPVEKVIAWDGLAVVVNRANGISEISIEQLSDMYTGKIKKWSEVGGDQGDIQLVSRESSSGTYESFRELVVQEKGRAKDRDFAPEVVRQSATSSVMATVAQTKGAIGYIGLGYLDSSVKVLAILPLGGGQAITPSDVTVRDLSYPIARELQVYTNGEPTGVVKDYLDWAMGPEGQALVKAAGYITLKE